ncbi:MAG: hypothetical protein JWP12_1528 [Bacteroidetes bacterium]|nr:hypothetical protein [Bacteroidota bacterium]
MKEIIIPAVIIIIILIKTFKNTERRKSGTASGEHSTFDHTDHSYNNNDIIHHHSGNINEHSHSDSHFNSDFHSHSDHSSSSSDADFIINDSFDNGSNDFGGNDNTDSFN